jgi:hypothetical protein
MFAMSGMRVFSLAATRGSGGVSCGADGVFIGDVRLLQSPDADSPLWQVRSVGELNKELTARYRLPIEVASKAGALALIAAALNRGDLAMAAIATVQMQIPDPPPLAKRAETPAEIARRARELIRSGLLKFWDPKLHPRAGVPPNPGWFAPETGASETAPVIPVMLDDPWEPPWWKNPRILEGGGGGGVPRGQLEFPFPRFRFPWSRETPAVREEASPKGSAPAEVQPELEFPGGLPQQRAPAAEGTSTEVPARGGRLGNAATRAQNAEIAAELENRGYRITNGGGAAAEEFIPGEGPGIKGGTFVDITAVDGTTGKWLRVQTVDTLADGITPNRREQAAIARILWKYPNDELWIIPKR